jgi:hypothetical protein
MTLHLPHVVFIRRHLGRVSHLDATPTTYIITCPGHVLRCLWQMCSRLLGFVVSSPPYEPCQKSQADDADRHANAGSNGCPDTNITRLALWARR